jgi:hypothetical protein
LFVFNKSDKRIKFAVLDNNSPLSDDNNTNGFLPYAILAETTEDIVSIEARLSSDGINIGI